MNPYSIINLFFRKRLSTYWPLSGKPAHISKFAAENPLEYIQPKLGSYFSEEIETAGLREISPVPVLFHSGYLTIDRQVVMETSLQLGGAREEAFIFKIPNMEVEKSFKSFIFG
jgi:hypothetical protein